jgi:hypothetical protein
VPLVLSVVICTYNRATLLKQTLEQFTRVQAPAGDWELLVVDNNSTDDTASVVQAFEGRLPIRRVFEPRQGRAWALNRSIAEARADLLAWTDDDVLVSEHWMVAFVTAAGRYPEAGVFGGPIDPWFVTPPNPTLVAAFPVVGSGFCGLDYRLPEGVMQPPYRAHGANMACRRSRTGGALYDVNLGPSGGQWMGNDDTAFVEAVRATGASAVWVPEMRVRHYVDPSRLQLTYLRSFYRGVGLTWIRHEGPPAGRQVLGAPVWLWRKYAEHLAGYCATRPFSRLHGWTHLRELCKYEGAIKAAREFAARA